MQQSRRRFRFERSLNDDAGISALARVTSTSSAASSKTDEDAYVSANEGASDASVDDDHDDERHRARRHRRDARDPSRASTTALLNVPITQETPLMTEDMSAEPQARLRRLSETTRAVEPTSRAQSDSLVSDMSAFKAANPSRRVRRFRSVALTERLDRRRRHAGRRRRRTTDGRMSAAVSRPRCTEQRMRRDGNAWRTP